MEPLSCPDTSLYIYQSALHNISVHRRFQISNFGAKTEMRLKTNTSLHRAALCYLNLFTFAFDNYDLSKVIYLVVPVPVAQGFQK